MILQKEYWRFPGYHAWNIFYQICFTSCVKKTEERLLLSNFTMPFLPLDLESSFLLIQHHHYWDLCSLIWWGDSLIVVAQAHGNQLTPSCGWQHSGGEQEKWAKNHCLQTKVSFGVFFHKKWQLGQYSKMLWVVNRGYFLYSSDIFLTLLNRLCPRAYGKTF